MDELSECSGCEQYTGSGPGPGQRATGEVWGVERGADFCQLTVGDEEVDRLRDP